MLGASEAYRMWAPTYADETAISYLEDKLVGSMTPALNGLRLLDAGCGTGRRLRNAGAAVAVGLEPSQEMIAAGVGHQDVSIPIDIVEGDVRNMPLPSRSFDVIWCRLVLGHLRDIRTAYRELARVADRGGLVIVSDFHPTAIEAGHRRTFRADSEVIELEHHVHRADDHIAAARAAGLGVREIREIAISSDVRCFYECAGRLDAFPNDFGLPVVLALSFRRER